MIDDTGHAHDSTQRQLHEYFSAWLRAIGQAAGNGGAPGADGLGSLAGGPWLQAIHQLARQALEQGLDSAGIVQAWRQILQQGLWPDSLPLGNLFDGIQPPWAQAGSDWLDQPAFGPLREHLQRWQQLAQQQRQSQAGFANWQALLTRIRELALEQFESLLRDHEQRPLADARALLDLWVEAAENAWQQVAMGEEFAQLLGQLNQTQMQLIQAQQGEAERVYAALGIASRRELDQAYARIDALERQVRQLLAAQAAPAAGTGAKPRRAAVSKTANKKASKKASKAAPSPAAEGKPARSAAAAAPKAKTATRTAAGASAASAAGSKRPARRTDKG